MKFSKGVYTLTGVCGGSSKNEVNLDSVRDEINATEKLIMASPEMLFVLEMALNQIESDLEDSFTLSREHICHKIKNILKKAKGV